MRFRLFSLCLLLACASSLFGQAPIGNIVGRVIDQSGAVIAGATVVVRNTETNQAREVTSGASGQFTVANLSPGHYGIVVKKEGFQQLDERGLELQVDQTARLDLQLQVGAVSQVLEVTASVPALNTESAMKGDVVVAREMTDLPLDGRDFSNLALLVPGVGQAAQGAQGSDFAVNGARADNTNFIIDGLNDYNVRDGTAQVSPPIDAMMEFKLQTTGYSAEYGRLAGGTMNMVLKSGTNKLHGSVFEFLRNDAFDARNFFDPEKAKLRRNQFGTVLDGPVKIPRLYNGSDRTFFLFDWEGYRQAQASNALDIVPTALERQGDFSQTILQGKHVALLDPSTTGSCAGSKFACFPNQKIPDARIDSVARQVAAYYPLPNRAGVDNFYASKNHPDVWDNFLGKIDQRLSSADTLSFRFLGRYEHWTNPFGDSNTGLFGDNFNEASTLTGLNYNRVFSPSLINEFRMGMSRTTLRQVQWQQGHDYAAEWGLKGFSPEPLATGFPLFTVTNIVALGNAKSSPKTYAVTTLQWADTLTYINGRHMMKFGFDLQRTMFFQPYYNNTRGTLNFNGQYTGVSSPSTSYDPQATAVPLADFLLGLPNQVTRTAGTNDNYLFISNFGFFAQDDFKITRSLTLNFGLRYEIPKAPWEKYGRWSNFIPETGKVILASNATVPNLQQQIASAGLTGTMLLASDVGLPQSLVYTDYHAFAPRFGFAWRPLGDQRTVLRGGYGIFYGGTMINTVRTQLGDVFPFTLSQTFSKNPNLTLQNPLGVTPNIGGTLTPSGYQDNPPASYLQSWNLTVERELGGGTAIEIGYVGSKGTDLGKQYDINQKYRLAQYGANSPRPFPAFNQIKYFTFGMNSSYNAGMITVRKRITRSLFYRVNYVYSKSIDTGSQIGDSSAGGTAMPQDSRNFAAERGRSDWDRGHSFTTMFIYDLPFHRSRLFRDWQIGGTGRLQTGPPFTPKLGGTTLDNGEPTRPDRIAKGTVPNPSPDHWFDPSAFPAAPMSAYRFGNSGRNILDGPGLLSLNLSLIRRFPIGERGSLQFRAEMFNTLNHPSFRLPTNGVTAADAGVITQAGDPRLLQLSLRYQF